MKSMQSSQGGIEQELRKIPDYSHDSEATWGQKRRVRKPKIILEERTQLSKFCNGD
jgi:hypothetical protein